MRIAPGLAAKARETGVRPWQFGPQKARAMGAGACPVPRVYAPCAGLPLSAASAARRRRSRSSASSRESILCQARSTASGSVARDLGSRRRIDLRIRTNKRGFTSPTRRKRNKTRGGDAAPEHRSGYSSSIRLRSSISWQRSPSSFIICSTLRTEWSTVV